MKLGRRRGSGDIIDRRGEGQRNGIAGRQMALGGGLGIPLLVLAAVVYLVLGPCGSSSGFSINSPFEDFRETPVARNAVPEQDAQADLVEFVSFVLRDAQGFWADYFERSGMEYRPARLVLYEQFVDSGCGPASAETGPFYCPIDEQIYLDLSFFRELTEQFDAPGDFAQAYVIAHELGHHLQNITGISDQVTRLQQRNPREANELSVRLELQADCLAGVWGYSTYERELLEAGDLDEGLNAAAAVGDDVLQEQAGAQVDPESWTHGSAEQRKEWFMKGYDAGTPDACDTF